jgi:tetraacyldisaccharide 4'-kinase
MIILRLLLLPLSLVYYCIVSVRNFLFTIKVFKSVSFNTPVISIGNITTGGTGKTPFVIFLTNYFISKGKSVGVISRGYKRKSNDLAIAYDGKTITSDVHSTGDELLMIIYRFLGSDKFFAIAYHDRVKAINEMINKFSPDIIILDDAFQNRKVVKTIDIVIQDKENKTFLNNFLLPGGNLRETSRSLKRADIILYNYKFKKPDSTEENVIEYELTGIFDESGKKVEIQIDKKAILFSGIANNTSFHNIVSKQNIDIFNKFEFFDHYDYTYEDIERFIALYKGNLVFITTEKDFIKIREFKEFISNYPVYYLRIDVILINSSLDNLLRKKNIL